MKGLRQYLGELELRPGTTLVTANNRLSRLLGGLYAEDALARGLTSWETPDILPWNAWLQRAWEATTAHGLAGGPSPGFLLTPLQEQTLWEAAIAASDIGVDPSQLEAAARLAREAHILRHGWRMPLGEGAAGFGREVAAFLDWSRRFEARCRRSGWIDQARLPDRLGEFVEAGGHVPLPETLALLGFDEFTPQQQALLETLESLGVGVHRPPPASVPAAAVRRIGFADVEAEIAAAAAWIRARLGRQPGLRLGVVVPDLPALRATVTRIFDDLLVPAAVLPGSPGVQAVYNLSAGAPLASQPVIHAALEALALTAGPLPLERAGSLLRSPFLAGAEQELARRATLDARLRARRETALSLASLPREARAAGCTALVDLAGLWQRAARLPAGRRLPPSAWVEYLFRALAAAGWPGERPPSSEEFQAVEAWRELVASLATLDAIRPALDLGQAIGLVRRLSQERMFQPERADTPVQVIGVLEASGMRFDGLWVLGLHDGVWPPAPEPNPFLPVVLQRRLGLPRSSPERELAVARRVHDRLSAAAPEVFFSHPLREADRELRPSPLIETLPADDASASGFGPALTFARTLLGAALLETLDDAAAPTLASGGAPGGSRLFQLQAACPFRAFAELRLNARPLKEKIAGLEPSDRGKLIHRVLDRVWSELRTSEALAARDAAALEALVREAAAEAVSRAAREAPHLFPDRFRALEEGRLVRRVLEWFEVERLRSPFDVEATEHELRLELAGLAVAMRIDRIDRLPGGGRVIIDYKTGDDVAIARWFGERPDEPQLPLYGLAFGDELEALAFARVKAGGMAYCGVARAAEVAPGIRRFEDIRQSEEVGSWPAQRAAWRRTFEALATDFASGRAEVAPKDPVSTCAHCGLTALCRINEATALDEEREEAGP